MVQTILVVDDEEIILNLLEEYFNILGYSVLTANAGEDALKIIKENINIDLVMTDVKMTGMSGIDLLKMIREYRRDLPVVIITGFKTIDNAVAAVKYGAVDYISKPFNLEDVKIIIQNVFKARDKENYDLNLDDYLVEGYFKYQFKTSELNVEGVARHLSQILLNQKLCTPSEYNQFYIAFTEVIINAIEHGNLGLESKIKGEDFNEDNFDQIKQEKLSIKEYAEKKVTIFLKFCTDHFELSVEDEGKGFNYHKILESIEDPVASLDCFGRGFMYLNHLMDSFSFNEKGNKITLYKKLKLEK